jgi:type IV pilus assembly protein PilW
MKKINAKKAAGFTIVEIMVGMVIGIIGMIIIMQIFSFVEGQKRTTTGTGDAQTAGVAAMFTLQREIRLGGYGFNSLNVLGCQLDLGGGKVLPTLAHVIINPAGIPAGDANTDTLLVVHGVSNGASEGEKIIHAGGTQLTMPSSRTYKQNDKVIASQLSLASGCVLKLANVNSIAGTTLNLATGDGAVSGGSLFNMGASPKILVYAIRKGNLAVCDFMANDCAQACALVDGTCSSDWVPVADGIVSLRAQYGRDAVAPLNGSVDTWDQMTPAPQPTQMDLACLWTRVPAVRIALVARNSQTEKEAVTSAAPTWFGSEDHPIVLTATHQNWQQFRYKLFQTVIPIRNIPWITLCP